MEAPDFKDWPDGRLHAIAISEYAAPPERGAATAEIERRKREYEIERDAPRRSHDFDLMATRGRLNAVQQDFDERIAREQMAHAEKIASKQVAAATSSATATKWAAVAAGISAFAGIVSVALAIAHNVGR